MTLTSLESLSFDFFSIAGGVVIRSIILAGLCGIAAWLLRSRTAALRHLLWKSLLWALLLLPVLLVLLPPLERTSGPLTLVEVAMLPKAPAAHVSVSPLPAPGVLAGSNQPLRLRWLARCFSYLYRHRAAAPDPATLEPLAPAAHRGAQRSRYGRVVPPIRA